MKVLVAAIAALSIAACGAVAPKPAPAGTPLSVNQLKFAVIDAVGIPSYCDRDFYPLARARGEQASAIAQYAQIKADAELSATLVAHEHLPAGDLTDAQKLVL